MPQEVLTINVQPGWKDGTRITFAGKGDELPGQLPQVHGLPLSSHEGWLLLTLSQRILPQALLASTLSTVPHPFTKYQGQAPSRCKGMAAWRCAVQNCSAWA